jgi:hypothetical protein
LLKVSYYEYVMGSSAQQFTNIAAVAERIEQGVRSGKIYTPTKKKGGRSTMLKVTIGLRNTNSKITTLYLKLPT